MCASLSVKVRRRVVVVTLASLPEKLSVFIKFFLLVWRLETNRVQFRNIKIIETKKTT